LLGDLTADGMAVVLVEHDVPLVMETCAQIHVLDFGHIIASGTPEQIKQDRGVLEAYLGAGQGAER
jgi:branched-chain amino acid transport system ATP-binding protein